MTQKTNKITKQGITQTALQILSEQGSDALTSSKLCEKLKISKDTLFHHFENMDQIQMSVLQYLTDMMLGQVENREHKNLRSFIDDTMQTMFESIEQHRGAFAAMIYFFGQALYKPTIQQQLRILADAVLDSWKQQLFQHVQTKLSEEEKDQIARIIDMHFGGLCIHDFIYTDLSRYKRITQRFMDIIVTYIEQTA